MAERKTERIMNLFFALLSSRQFLTRDQIREAIPDYRESTAEAFERKFERDKDELRAIGVEVESGSIDKYFDDVQGYRIRRDLIELPDISFTSEEVAVLSIAAGLWGESAVAGSSARALTKLKSIGVDVDAVETPLADTRLGAADPAFIAVWDANQSRTAIEFDYTAAGTTKTQRRRLQPWRLVLRSDAWYVLGFDLDRDAARVFRLSRISGAVKTSGGSGAYRVPDDLDVRSIATPLFPDEPTDTAVLRVAAGRANSLRQRATSVESTDEGFDRVTVGFGDLDALARDVVSFAPEVVVESPAELRERVREHLAHLVAVHA